MSDFPIQFERPEALLLLILIVPILWIGWRKLTGMGPIRRGIVCGIRVLVVLLLTLTIAKPQWQDRGEALSLVLLIDRSRSISPQLELQAVSYLRDAVNDSDNRRNIDRLAVINIGAEARVRQLPEQIYQVDPGTPVISLDATNLAAGLNMGMAIAPQDTATRFVLVSDGNENVGNALAEASKVAANKIPIDILRLEYEYEREVMFDRVAAPSSARQGQNVSLNLVIRSQAPATGTIALTQNGEPVDLDPTSDATGIRVSLEEGVNTRPVTVMLNEQGPQRFRAEFRPDVAEDDSVTSNNVAESVVIVQGEGRILLVQESDAETQALRDVLREAQIDVTTLSPLELESDVLALSGYDSIILANVPAHSFAPRALEGLRRYVHDVGGGFIMIGGPSSFGAGGWIGTPIEKALPLRLDPPDIQRMPKGALVCIMHSCEIPAGNYWGQKCAEAAINALSRLDLAGIIDFSPPGDFQGCTWTFPLQELGDKSGAIAAIRKMTMGDMPDFQPSMQMAYDALVQANASQKHVIIISDGDPSPPSANLLAQYKQAGITISTVVSGGHGIAQDDLTMKRIADSTGGKYYNPGNRFSQMPQIFWKEAITVRKSLIREGDIYQAVHRPSVRPGPFAGRWTVLPASTGYVVTAPRPGYDPEITIGTENEPLFAHWQYGLGRSAAFTTDATSRWGAQWTSWSEFKGFWEQVVRWSMRPSAPMNVELNARLDGSNVIVEAQILGSEGSFSTFGRMEGVVLSPSLESSPISLQQTGPGRGRAEFRADEPGAWVVNLVYDDPEGGKRSIQTGISIPFSQEFRTVRDNAPLLQELASRTGGRELPTNPQLANLFEREGLVVPLSMTDFWTLLAVITTIAFLFDVATRRIAFDRQAFQRRWQALWFGGATRAEEAMGRLKSTRSEVRDRLATRGGTAGDHAEETGTPRDGRRTAATRFEATSDEGAISVEELAAGGDAASDVKARRPSRDEQAKANAAEGKDDADSMSRLLAAKRRAAQQDPKKQNRPDSEGDGNG